MSSYKLILSISFFSLSVLSAIFLLTLSQSSFTISRRFLRLPKSFQLKHTTSTGMSSSFTAAQLEWRKVLDELPANSDKIPAFFFAHGSPILAFPPDAQVPGIMGAMFTHSGPNGPLSAFLKDFGPALLKKYDPKGIVVFSAHWETSKDRLGASQFTHYRH